MTRGEREPLQLFANQIALAVERAQLREQALRARVTEEMARLARTMVAAVSHDLRAPLASIKGVVIDAGRRGDRDQPGCAAEPGQAHRRAGRPAGRRWCSNLLDMSRIQAGVLQPRRCVSAPADLVSRVVSDMTPALRGHPVQVDVPAELAGRRRRRGADLPGAGQPAGERGPAQPGGQPDHGRAAKPARTAGSRSASPTTARAFSRIAGRRSSGCCPGARRMWAPGWA